MRGVKLIDWAVRGQTHATEEAYDLSTNEGTSALVSYLVRRFMAVLIPVMLLESIVVWVESVLLLPMLRDALGETTAFDARGTTSLVSLMRWVFGLIFSMGRADILGMAGFARSSLAVLLILVMIALLMLPLLVGALVFARGVVAQVRMLQEHRERELAQIDQQRSQFMTDVAHDLRTPLMAIAGMAHALSDGVVPNDTTRTEYLGAICDKADKMSGLVSSVFDYTKLGSAAFSLDRKDIDLPQLLLREAAVAYTDIEDAAMHFTIEVPEDPCVVHADEVQLARVVANLLTNAVRHNGPGTEIALMLVRRAGVAYVMVADTGEVITSDAEELFQPFSRGDAARLSTGGSGLGLSICRRIADLHGYRLSLVQPYGRFTKAFVLQCTVV